MDEWMDMAWEQIVAGFVCIGSLLDQILLPINHRIGPALTIALLVVLLVALTKLLSNAYTTKRYLELQKNYEHWYELRQAAMACDDPEKGRVLARNIDQAQLNKAYYDYFFEGFLKSIITVILPVLFAAAYINHAYAPEKLARQIGRTTLFSFARSNGEPIHISAFFWFVICLIGIHLGWAVISIILKRRKASKQTT